MAVDSFSYQMHQACSFLLENNNDGEVEYLDTQFIIGPLKRCKSLEPKESSSCCPTSASYIDIEQYEAIREDLRQKSSQPKRSAHLSLQSE